MASFDEVKLEDILHCSFATFNPDTGANKDADSLPTAVVYEEGSSTALVSTVTVTNMTTGRYRLQVTVAAADGYEAGKFYELWVSATVTGTGSPVTQSAPLVSFKATVSVVDDVATAVWDEVLTGATHNIASSAGRRLRQVGAFSIADGTAQAGTANSITLAAGESAVSDIYPINYIVITAGTGAGETRIITEYDGTTKVARVNRQWLTTPDATSEYTILANGNIHVADVGTLQSATATTATLRAAASSVPGSYFGATLMIATGTGREQVRQITAYNETTKEATVSPAWTTTPDNTSDYIVSSGVGVVVATSSALATAQADLDTITGADGVNLLAATQAQIDGLATQASVDVIDGIVDTILVDTNELQTNQGDWATADVSALATQASVDTIDGIVDTIELWTKRNAVVLSGIISTAGTNTEVFTISALGITGTFTVDSSGNRSDVVWS